MVATIKDGKKFTKKARAPRTSTIEATIASKDTGFKQQPKKVKKVKKSATSKKRRNTGRGAKVSKNGKAVKKSVKTNKGKGKR